jgi:hypothetical protein
MKLAHPGHKTNALRIKLSNEVVKWQAWEGTINSSKNVMDIFWQIL